MGVALSIIAAATLVPSPGAIGGLPVVWCVTCSPNWLSDAISNVALFVPLGAALALLRVRTGRALLTGAGLSLLVEILQYLGLPPGRTPALADVITNSTGSLLGVAIIAGRAALWYPRVNAARVLLALWTIAVSSVLVVSSWLLSPATRSVGASSPVNASSLPFTPGYGWYLAEPDSGFVNGVGIPHDGTGPVIAQMARTDTVRLSVLVRGRDARHFTVPVLYVHAPDERRAHVLLGQRGTSAVVRTATVARRYGLNAPELALHDVFALSARPALARVKLEGTVARGFLSLTASEGDSPQAVRQATLEVTPALAWSLFQGVVRLDSPAASLMTTLWLLAWFAPGGYWMARACRTGTTAANTVAAVIAWGASMIGVTHAGAATFEVQPLETWQALLAALETAVGAAAGWLTINGGPPAP